MGNLGFYSLFSLVVFVVGVILRQKWRNAAERKEEIMRLVAMASEEAAAVELEAAVEYSSIPVARRYQCAACYGPATTRCSQCKAVRYCSGKCQIKHWRQGHKNECVPPTPTSAMQFNDGSGFGGKTTSENQFENYDAKTTTGSLSTSTSSFYGLTPSAARSEPFIDVSVSDVLGSSTPDSSKGLSDDISCDSFVTISNVNNIISTACASKLNQMKSICDDEVDHFQSQFPKAKTAICDDTRPRSLSNKKSNGGARHSDASKHRSSPLLSRSGSDFLASDSRNEPQVKCKEVSSVSSTVSDHSSPAPEGHSASVAKSAKHTSPNIHSEVAGLQQNAYNGLRTSVRKVAQHFRASKQSKPQLLGIGNGIAGKYNHKMLFPYELFMELYSWEKVELSPFGLMNCGNSCYANAVLQCLTFTRPLASYLLQGLHSKACPKEDWCFICEFECLILEAREGKSPLSPMGILSQIQRIGSHLGHGREEDAHEFLRYAVDTMQSVCLKDTGVVGPLAEDTTLVGLTFGGYLLSKIKCMKCRGKSERCERMMDLTVEIDGDIGTLEEALAQFTATEILDGENKYQCGRCRSYEKAKKKLMVLEAPNILTIVLKRFQSSNFGKLNKSVRFPETLNMTPYMSGTDDRYPVYSLYAVVVHLDIMNAAFSGHYVCFVKNFLGDWFRIDDSTVTPVELDRVLLEGAYMLLYARRSPKPPALSRNMAVSHEGKLKMRNLEAVPSSLAATKPRSNSAVPGVDRSMIQRKPENSCWTTWDGPTSNQWLRPEDWRSHSMQRVGVVDSSSESSSLFSCCSDEGSCSTESTNDSASTGDFSDYIFGEVGNSWYRNYGLSSDSDITPSLFSRPSGSSRSNGGDGVRRRLPHQGSSWGEELEGEGNSSFLYNGTSKHSKMCTTQFGGSSSETDLGRLVAGKPIDVKSGVPFKRASRERSAQTFY